MQGRVTGTKEGSKGEMNGMQEGMRWTGRVDGTKLVIRGKI